MEKSGFDRFLTILLALLVIGVLVTSGYLIKKYIDKYTTNKEANNVINEFDKRIEERNTVPEPEPEPEPEDEPTGPRGIIGDYVTMGGYRVDGKLEMPTVNLQYPVLAQMTDANAIEVSVAIQYGVGLNNVGNTVIIGHNYRDGLFFGSNKNLQNGDIIYITDWETGTRRAYAIYNKYTAEEADTSYYSRDTGGRREVTLVTCQSDNNYRLVILAKEV